MLTIKDEDGEKLSREANVLAQQAAEIQNQAGADDASWELIQLSDGFEEQEWTRCFSVVTKTTNVSETWL